MAPLPRVHRGELSRVVYVNVSLEEFRLLDELADWTGRSRGDLLRGHSWPELEAMHRELKEVRKTEARAADG